MIKTYYQLTKPGIVFGNVITAIAGFLLASKGSFDLLLFCATLLGLSCIVGAACVVNNYRDRFIDAKMERTKNRALASGSIPLQHALVFGSALALSGTLILGLYTNPAALSTALAGFVIYAFVYTPLKQQSTYATEIGGIAGALPPAVGYCAVTGRFDFLAYFLFGIVALWQMPHFFAIALYRLRDYASASVPVLPVKRGIPETKIRMLVYILCFAVSAPLPTLLGYTGMTYAVGITGLNGIWIYLAIRGLKGSDSRIWAKKMFLFSLLIIMGFSGLIAFG